MVLSWEGLLMWQRWWLIQYNSTAEVSRGTGWKKLRNAKRDSFVANSPAPLRQWLCHTPDFVASFVRSTAVRENRRLSSLVCRLIYCSPTHRWKINGKPSERSQYNKWPIQTGTYSTPGAAAEPMSIGKSRFWLWREGGLQTDQAERGEMLQGMESAEGLRASAVDHFHRQSPSNSEKKTS